MIDCLSRANRNAVTATNTAPRSIQLDLVSSVYVDSQGADQHTCIAAIAFFRIYLDWGINHLRILPEGRHKAYPYDEYISELHLDFGFVHVHALELGVKVDYFQTVVVASNGGTRLNLAPIR